MVDARRSRGKWSPTSDDVTGCTPASPTPTPIRQSRSCAKLPTKPQAAVISDQSRIAPDRMRTRE